MWIIILAVSFHVASAVFFNGVRASMVISPHEFFQEGPKEKGPKEKGPKEKGSEEEAPQQHSEVNTPVAEHSNLRRLAEIEKPRPASDQKKLEADEREEPLQIARDSGDTKVLLGEKGEIGTARITDNMASEKEIADDTMVEIVEAYPAKETTLSPEQIVFGTRGETTKRQFLVWGLFLLVSAVAVFFCIKPRQTAADSHGQDDMAQMKRSDVFCEQKLQADVDSSGKLKISLSKAVGSPPNNADRQSTSSEK